MHIYVPIFGKGGVVMGYRSEVMMVITGKRIEEVMALMDAAGWMSTIPFCPVWAAISKS